MSARAALLAALLPGALLPAALAAQEVADCDGAPPVTDLVEPWEESAAVLAAGAVRLAVLEGEEGTRRLLVLTLPPPPPGAAEAPVPADAATAEAADGTAPADPGADPEADPGAEVPDETTTSDPGAPPPARHCRIVTEGGLGFADLDLSGLDAAEDPEAGTLTLRVPALGFIPESTELLPHVLVLTFGVADDSLAAAIE